MSRRSSTAPHTWASRMVSMLFQSWTSTLIPLDALSGQSSQGQQRVAELKAKLVSLDANLKLAGHRATERSPRVTHA